MAKLDDKALEFFRALGRKGAKTRWAGKSEDERKATAQVASRAYWDSMTPEQRSAEMKRRAAKRKKKG